MWYLIIPPLVFLGSLWLLLLFLSRRVTDPALLEKLSKENEPGGGRRILFIKEETGLRVLEKINQRMKVFFLKLHNASGTLSQSLKARRERFREKGATPTVSGADVTTTVLRPREQKKPFWMRFRSNEESGVAIGEAGEIEGGASPLSIAVDGQENDQQERQWDTRHPGDSVHEQKVPSTMITRRREANEKPKRLVSEEDLIGKIAKNPKDAVAYEELGDYYMETKQLEDAKACYRQVIKLLPMNREVKEKVRKLERLLTRAGR